MGDTEDPVGGNQSSILGQQSIGEVLALELGYYLHEGTNYLLRIFAVCEVSWFPRGLYLLVNDADLGLYRVNSTIYHISLNTPLRWRWCNPFSMAVWARRFCNRST